jgi:hypothetical protein
MAKPRLRQFGDLSAADFERHPVWIACHTADCGEPWYGETNEETFRPWTGTLPVAPSDGMLLVRATLQLPDGTRYAGFVTPTSKDGDLGVQQPQIFVGDRRFDFWGGIRGHTAQERHALYAALGRDPDAIFPLQFNVDPRLATGSVAGEVLGFYRHRRDQTQIDR